MFFKQGQKLRRRLQLRQPGRYVRLLRELSNLSKHGQILVGYFQGRGDDQEEVVDGLIVDGLEVDPFRAPTKPTPQTAHDQ
jgi:hypothetical protein